MGDQKTNYNNVIETLFTTFSAVIEKDVIASVVESYEGDLNQSANALMNIAGDLNPVNFNQPLPDHGHNVPHPLNNINSYNNFHENAQVAMPYLHMPQQNMPVVNRPYPNAQGPIMYGHGPNQNIPVENNRLPPNMPMAQGAMPFTYGSPQNTQGEPSPFQIQAHGTMSYASASLQKMPVENNEKLSKPPLKKVISNTYWSDQIREVISNYNKGWRVLILMRGVAGCGKSFLAQEILQMTVGEVKNIQIHIMSTDDFFYTRGVYNHDKSRLQEAHWWNQRRAKKAMEEGISPVMVDNTNIEVWEMEPYVKIAVNNGYIVNVVEPQTPWAKKANQLFKKNVHRVPYQTIQRMLDNYREGLTGHMLLNRCKLKYPENLTPPVLRNIPPLPPDIKIKTSDKNNTIMQNVEIKHEKDVKNLSSVLNTQKQKTDDKKLENICSSSDQPEQMSQQLKAKDTNKKTTEDQKHGQNIDYAKVEKCLDEYQQVENAWENGENWEEGVNKASTSATIQAIASTSSKPQRNKNTLSKASLIPFEPSEDWSKLSAFPSVSQDTLTLPETSIPAINKITSSTCFEIGDTDISNDKNPLKIVTAVPRDINMFILPKVEKIPNQRMLDKSTTTNNELILMKPVRCQNEEQHFKAFRKMFNHIPSAALRDIFENCCGDVNWAVEIVIDGMENKQFGVLKEENLSEDEDNADNSVQCACLAAYNIIPDTRSVANEKANPALEAAIDESNTSTASPKKIRKETQVSNISMQLKRQIEKNVVISDNHYSEHCLKIRNLRRGNQDEGKNKSESNGKEEIIDSTICPVEEPSNIQEIDVLPSTSTKMSEDTKLEVQSEFDEDDCIGVEDVEKTINITIGKEFIAHLDKLFGREDMKYPEHVIPKINVPVSMLNEINALWMESLMHQLDQDSKQTEAMIEQDAEFARELAQKEEEFLLAGKTSEMPDFQEIMDLDFALSLYQKDIDEMRMNEPLDMAAKLTRDKLYDMFPEFCPTVLLEILMAHNNVFQDTVEAVLLSMGKSDIVKEKDGVKRYIMSKELEFNQRFIEEKSKALSEVEWPVLPRDKTIGMEDVEKYRKEATRQMELRHKSYQKAKEYMRRGMLPVASFFSSAGALHTRLFEQANSKAAVSLAEVNAQRCKNNLTLDLHNYRVCESLESLDLFLDIHIQKLRQVNGRNGLKWHTLFFITGRGLHSRGEPKVKPACKRRLKERGLNYYELNPGLLGAKVSAFHKLSDEIA